MFNDGGPHKDFYVNRILYLLSVPILGFFEILPYSEKTTEIENEHSISAIEILFVLLDPIYYSCDASLWIYGLLLETRE